MVDLAKEIINKAELAGILPSVVEEYIQRYYTTHPKVQNKYTTVGEKFLRSKEWKLMRKEIREDLRVVYGVFFTDQYNKKEQLVDELIQTQSNNAAKSLLAIHRSTKERLPYYDILYKQLFTLSCIPESILDLGCGFNPFSYTFLPNAPTYHAADIACSDLSLIAQYLESLGIEHSTHCIDLTHLEAYKELPKADIIFALKVFDSLEEKEYGIAENILSTLTPKFWIVSFPTVSIGGRKGLRSREWFEALVTEKIVDIVTFPNEQFYIITG